MAEYQNIFTQVQVRGPLYAGVPTERDIYQRAGGDLYRHQQQQDDDRPAQGPRSRRITGWRLEAAGHPHQ